MPSERGTRAYATKELSRRTWDDYVRFFSQGNGWDHCGCNSYQGFRAPSKVGKWADKRDWCLDVKSKLLERGLAHGILVYANREPVGWCQYGPTAELPVPVETRKQILGGAPGWKRAGPGPGARGSGWSWEGDEAATGWRITCFCTDKEHAGEGVAELALGAALDAIRKRGGGLVEAFPVATIPETDERLVAAKRWRSGAMKLVREHGRFSPEVERALESRPGSITVPVEGVGDVNGIEWMYGYMHAGTVSMFERAGFTAVGTWGSGPRVVMHKRVRRA